MSRPLLLLLFAAGCAPPAIPASTEGSTDADLQALIVSEAQSEKVIRHAVEWQGPFDSHRQETTLVGPRMLARELRVAEDADRETVFSLYELPARETTSAKRRVAVANGRSADLKYTLGGPGYFLVTTQILAAGTPAEFPETLGQYVAYAIVEHSGSETKPTGDSAGISLLVKKPLYVCLPVDEWHHHEHFPASKTRACWVVYEAEQQDRGTTISTLSTLDQFGLNQLKLGPAKWVCLPRAGFAILE